MEVFFLIVLALFVYFLPTIIGSGKRNAFAIFAANVFFGWTVIGWFIILVWALTVDKE